jgi:hypothetical protein
MFTLQNRHFTWRNILVVMVCYHSAAVCACAEIFANFLIFPFGNL